MSNTISCCNDEPYVNDNRFPSCEELELIELNSPGSSRSIGDTLKAVVHNNCKSCDQMVYTGLIAYSEQDTLALDIKLYGEWTPENDQRKKYQLRILRAFDLGDIEPVEMIGVCESVILKF